MELLRFIAAGSVDDGKSTLIGRLLLDTEAVQVDLLEAIRQSSERKGDERLNLALLTDGLKAEREQGITIDVAYKYFSTPTRKYIIADAPGHVQYTRNMVTGASTASLAVLLVDARKGVIEQTRRHSFLASLVGVPQMVLCINKMDLVDYSEEVFQKIRTEFRAMASRLGLEDVRCIPVNALEGDNVVRRSEFMPWYDGPTLLEHLESVPTESNIDQRDTRFPVQWVIRPQSAEYPDYRGYAGQVVSGAVRRGERVRVLPAGLESSVAAIDSFGTELEEAWAPMSVTLRLADELDISRGDIIVPADNLPRLSSELSVNICWMDEKPLKPRDRYLLQINAQRVSARIESIEHRVNIHTLEEETGIEQLELNDIARLRIRTQRPVCFDDYRVNHRTGSFILIDEGSNSTVAGGMIQVD
ncbi:MAG: sulfate adenylyltransferase [Spirochaetales bacterium]|nr:sulfate adenylyltransferase [Leptospiraceae bacterium]MCP5480525.1 sulfate adenylyltransferase [Spirochaetales bacterium]